jgi:hypothetical protein
MRLLGTFMIGAMSLFATSAMGATLSGFGTASVDGVISPGEWDPAGSVDFLVNTPGGGTAAATPLGDERRGEPLSGCADRGPLRSSRREFRVRRGRKQYDHRWRRRRGVERARRLFRLRADERSRRLPGGRSLRSTRPQRWRDSERDGGDRRDADGHRLRGGQAARLGRPQRFRPVARRHDRTLHLRSALRRHCPGVGRYPQVLPYRQHRHRARPRPRIPGTDGRRHRAWIDPRRLQTARIRNRHQLVDAARVLAPHTARAVLRPASRQSGSGPTGSAASSR